MSFVSDRQLRKTTVLFAGLFLIAAMILAFSLGGCAARVAHVTDLPPGVTESQAKNWDAAIADLHRIADLNTAARKTVIAARNAGAFPNDVAYSETLRVIGNSSAIELNIAMYLEKQPKTFGLAQKQYIEAQFSGLLEELQAINTSGITQIKNADTLKTVNGIIAEIEATAKLILAFQV